MDAGTRAGASRHKRPCASFHARNREISRKGVCYGRGFECDPKLRLLPNRSQAYCIAQTPSVGSPSQSGKLPTAWASASRPSSPSSLTIASPNSKLSGSLCIASYSASLALRRRAQRTVATMVECTSSRPSRLTRYFERINEMIPDG